MPAITPFTDLLLATLRTMRTRWTALVVGIVFCAALLAVAQWHIGGRVQQRAWIVTQGTGFDTARIEELGERIEAGDQAAMNEMIEILARENAAVEGMTTAEQEAYYLRKGMELFLSIAPLIALSIVVLALVGLLASTYFLVVALDASGDMRLIARRSAQVFIPLLGVWLWAFVRSFAWIPVLGIVPAIILGPRFALAGILYVRGEAGIRESVQKSYERTEGFWGKILGEFLLVALLLIVAFWVIAKLTGALPESLPFTQLMIDAMAQYTAIAFYTIFLVQLAATILGSTAGTAKGTKKVKKAGA